MSTPRKMSPAHRADARQLAVTMQAYHESVYRADPGGAAMWGRLLLAAQDRTGVVLHDPENLTARIATHDRDAKRAALTKTQLAA